MGFFEAVIRALLYLCGFALLFFLIIWILGVIGISIPIQIERIIMAMLALFAILILARLFYPWMSDVRWFPPRKPPE